MLENYQPRENTTRDVLFQVSIKQSELGIGQTSLLNYRFQVVDFLPAMYVYEFRFFSKRPKEITKYDTIVIPFDKYVWCFTFGCIITQFLRLVAMQNLWSYVTGTCNPPDFIFEGRIHNLDTFSNHMEKFQIFFSPLS